jgi:MYXO-CTERM domain-containing protein
MRLNRVALLLMAGAMVIVAAPLALAQTVLLDENFDDDAVGSIPGSVDIALGANGPGSDMEVVGPGSSYADPFGPAGNHSLVFDNFNGGSANPNVWPFAVWNNELGQPTTTYRQGTLEFDLYLSNDIVNGIDEKFWTYVDLRLGFNTTFPNTVGDTIVYGNFRVQDGVGYYFFDNAFGPSNGHPISPDTIHSVKYTILPNETYTLQIDGSYVEKDGSRFVPWRTTGPDRGFNVLAIGSAFGPNFLTNSPFFLDNLKVTATPEPGALGLGATAMAALTAVRRRRRQ